MKLVINLVAWNGEKYIPFLITSLKKQSYKDFKLCILDNDSQDNTVQTLKRELANSAIEYEIFQNQQNVGYAGGHNRLFKFTTQPYVILLNQDVCLTSSCIEKLMNFIEQNPSVAALTPRLMKWDFEQQNFTDIIDSLGLKVSRSRRVVDWRAGETWNNGISKNFKVFGVSGALPLFRRSVLQKVVDKEGNIFDPLFGSYKEDVDLAFRLRQIDVESWIVSGAVAYHDRSAAMPGKLGDTEALLNKQKQSEIVKYNSYRNHLYVLYKNEYWQNFIIDFPWIFWYELKKFVYFLLFDRVVLGGLKDVLKQRKRLKKSRVVSKQLRKLTWDKMRVWWN